MFHLSLRVLEDAIGSACAYVGRKKGNKILSFQQVHQLINYNSVHGRMLVILILAYCLAFHQKKAVFSRVQLTR